MTGVGRGGRWLPLLALVAALAGCSIPSWVPLIGKSRPPAVVLPPPPAGAAKAPLLPAREQLADSEAVLDRVVCVVNNDAITLSELDEAEAYYYHENGESPREGEARRELRDRILRRMIDNRLQLQQAERDKITVEDVEIAEQLADVMKKLNVATEAELQQMFKSQGVAVEGVKKRLRDQLMVQKVIRRKVTLRVSVTEQEIDRYLAENRDKLETGLTFEARHTFFLPEPGRGEEGWAAARRRAEAAHTEVLGGADFAQLAEKLSDDGSGKDGGHLGTLKRGELAADIERAILALQPGEISAPFRSEVGYHLFKLEVKETLQGAGLAQVRNQIRDILYREKYQARLREWLGEIKQRALIDIRI
jgi:peptidyl-prolyl cis-trans isomerase SurA